MEIAKNEPVIIRHSKSGATAMVYPFGGTVASFITSSNKELIFVSKLAKKDGSKAIRGGIPLVFPQFGQPNKDMPSHGFLRINYWNVGEKYDNEDEAGCDFTLSLKNVQEGRGDGVWSNGKVDCSLSFQVKVKASSLTTTLTIKNIGNEQFDYQTLLHTYYRINGSKALCGDLCNVVGLQGYSVDDKITKDQSEQDDSPIVIDKEVDRVYTPPAGKYNLDVVICTGEDKSKVSLKANASCEGKDIPVNVVVWNPFIEKAKSLGDFDDNEYHDMICVEPGLLSGLDPLAPGSQVNFEQQITSL